MKAEQNYVLPRFDNTNFGTRGPNETGICGVDCQAERVPRILAWQRFGSLEIYGYLDNVFHCHRFFSAITTSILLKYTIYKLQGSRIIEAKSK